MTHYTPLCTASNQSRATIGPLAKRHFEWRFADGPIVTRFYMSRNVRKPVFGASNKARLKPVSSATETNLKNEITLVASLDMILLN